MNIIALMQRIWFEVASLDTVKTEVRLSRDEWRLILKEWPELYGETVGVKKPAELTENLRDEWKSRSCFYLRGYEIKAIVE